ncbi:MAG TPA: hypothetical protein VF940_08795 [Streptosporangiaceae bacterium]
MSPGRWLSHRAKSSAGPYRTRAIAEKLVVTAGVVEKHIASIFAKLGLAPSDTDNRRVIAGIKYLES